VIVYDDYHWSWLFGALAIVVILVLCGSCAQDWWTSTPQVTEVTIIDKAYHPGHYDTTCNTDGKGHVSCTTDWIPPSWAIRYEDATERFTTSVSSGTYDALRLGDRKPLRYFQGGGWWHARYHEEFLLGPLVPEGPSWPVR
jgi:hypothetical protein